MEGGGVSSCGSLSTNFSFFECYFEIRFLKRAKSNIGEVLVSISTSQAGKRKKPSSWLYCHCVIVRAKSG